MHVCLIRRMPYNLVQVYILLSVIAVEPVVSYLLVALKLSLGLKVNMN
jgi:hypothetical protein